MKQVKISICIFLAFLCSSSYLFAQEELTNAFLFPIFEKGKVLFRTGLSSQASLNYNIVTEEMLFLDADSTILKISNPRDVIVVTIGERRFFPVTRDIFYEEIPVGKGLYYVQHRVKMLSEGKAAGYGGYSATSSVTNISSITNGGTLTNLSLNEKFRAKPASNYYLKIGKAYKKFDSVKTLANLFKENKSQIEKFAADESIDFSKQEDISRIVEYVFGLPIVN